MHLKPAKTLIFFYGRELLAVDETLERRLGKKIKAKGVYRDVILSSQTHAVITIWVKIGVHATDCPIAMVQAAMGTTVFQNLKSNDDCVTFMAHELLDLIRQLSLAA